MDLIKEIACPKCHAKCGQPCVEEYYGQGLDFNNPHGEVIEPHEERIDRFDYYKWGPKWPCREDGCDGNVLAIGAHDSISSTENCCNKCGKYVVDPGGWMTRDEFLGSLAPDLVETHELIDNPDAHVTKISVFENGMPPMIGEPDNKDAMTHLVPRTKKPEWNRFRALKDS